jgi:hypothetical protein
MVSPSPKFSVPQSRVQISGSSASTWDETSPAGRPESVFGAELHRVLASADFQVAAHAGGEVDDDVDVGLADALHHFAVQRDVAAEACRFADRAHGSAQRWRRPWPLQRPPQRSVSG